MAATIAGIAIILLLLFIIGKGFTDDESDD